VAGVTSRSESAAVEAALSARPIRTVVADDNFLVREALVHILARADAVAVVASCADRESVRAAVERQHPDAIVTDIRMPPTFSNEGIELADELRSSHPTIGVVVLSQFVEPSYAVSLFRSGAARRAYLLKERVHDAAQLVFALEEVVAGRSVVDPRVVEVLVQARARAVASPLSELTPREREVLGEVAQGKSNAAIANVLVLTKHAVEKHINSIFMKLGLAADDDVSRRVKATLMFLSGE